MNRHSICNFAVFFTVMISAIRPVQAASAPPLEAGEIAELHRSLAAVAAPAGAPNAASAPAELPRLTLTPRGHVRYLGAPPGQHFVPTKGLVAGQPAIVARDFLRERGRLFGSASSAMDFALKRERPGQGRTHLRFQQVYQNLPIVAAEVVVQVDAQGGIECVLSDIETDTAQLDNATISITPTLTAEQVVAAVKKSFADQAAGAPVHTTTPVLSVFSPFVLDETGPQQLVWDLVVYSDNRLLVDERVLWDAHGTNAVRVWTQRHTALNRQIADKANNPTGSATVVRTEGQAATGNTEVDNAYTYLGDTYNFYVSQHARDSFDNAGGMLSAVVRYCDTNNSCPWANASAGTPISFGNGWATEDVVAHEFTHNVTANESGLIYTNASGAINESLSDIWGEFVDLSNFGGNDDATNRWRIGEDLPGGPIRRMSFPFSTNVNPRFNDPDRQFSPYYQPPSNTSDNGGVHSNSGVNNKLCYLLTDGDTFNGQTISGLGIDQVVRLYYEAQVNLLTSAAGWSQLYDAVTQAAVNRGWNGTDRNNLYRACIAVEIATPGNTLYVDSTTGCAVPTGLATCFAPFGPYETVTQGVNGARPGDTLRIRSGHYAELISTTKILTLQTDNGPVTIGP